MHPIVLYRRHGKILYALIGTVLLGAWLFANTAHAQFLASDLWPNTDFSKTLVDLSEIQSGGPPKDGIPAIDKPRFVPATEADAWLDKREPVIAVSINGKNRAYPLQILMFHEIVNDELGGVPISVTFCPLCNASIVFDRRMQGQVLDFGTTGKLRKSDLVMYDRQTESWWQQLTGRAIVGKMAGTVLNRVPAVIVAYEDFRSRFPKGEILSRRTGYFRQYGQNPYRGYDRVGQQPFLYQDPVDPRLPAMERVLNISSKDVHKLYPYSALRATPIVNDQVADIPVVVFSRAGTLSVLDEGKIGDSRTIPSAAAYRRKLDGQTLDFEIRDGKIVDTRTRSSWDLFGRAVAGPLAGKQLENIAQGVHFAFAWLAFHPDSLIYKPAP